MANRGAESSEDLAEAHDRFLREGEAQLPFLGWHRRWVADPLSTIEVSGASKESDQFCSCQDVQWGKVAGSEELPSQSGRQSDQGPD